MAKNGKRIVRFDQLYQLFNMEIAGVNNAEITAKQIQYSGYVMFEKELSKFVKDHPEVNSEEFVKFLEKNNAYRKSGSKASSGGKPTKLNSIEKAHAIGVLAHHHDEYLAKINAMMQIRQDLQKIVPNGTVSIAIPIKKKVKA